MPEEYAAAFAEVQEQLRAGNSYEVNLTHRLSVTADLDPVTAYLRLRTLNPAPYAGYLQHRGRCLLSSSPERFATIDRHRMLETKPIKGTTPRGATRGGGRRAAQPAGDRPEVPRGEPDDRRPAAQRRRDGRASPARVEVPALMEVESYPSVHQLVSTVRGRLRDDVTTSARCGPSSRPDR